MQSNYFILCLNILDAIYKLRNCPILLFLKSITKLFPLYCDDFCTIMTIVFFFLFKSVIRIKFTFAITNVSSTIFTFFDSCEYRILIESSQMRMLQVNTKETTNTSANTFEHSRPLLIHCSFVPCVPTLMDVMRMYARFSTVCCTGPLASRYIHLLLDIRIADTLSSARGADWAPLQGRRGGQ